MILAGDVKDGDHVKISAEGNVLTFNGKAPQTAEVSQFEAPVPKAQAELNCRTAPSPRGLRRGFRLEPIHCVTPPGRHRPRRSARSRRGCPRARGRGRSRAAPAIHQRLVIGKPGLGLRQLVDGGAGRDDLGDGDIVSLSDRLDHVVPL